MKSLLAMHLCQEAGRQRENLRYQGHGEPLTGLAVKAAETVEALLEALEVYAHQLCEFGPSNEGCGKFTDDTCFGCRARAAIAKATGAS